LKIGAFFPKEVRRGNERGRLARLAEANQPQRTHIYVFVPAFCGFFVQHIFPYETITKHYNYAQNSENMCLYARSAHTPSRSGPKGTAARSARPRSGRIVSPLLTTPNAKTGIFLNGISPGIIKPVIIIRFE